MSAYSEIGPPGRGEGRGEGVVRSVDGRSLIVDGDGVGVGSGSLALRASSSERAEV